jgi:RNA polymerase sigma-70 factor, ECF subfamily
MKADAEIVQRVLQGDRESFGALVARHEKAVWATAWRILRDEHAASDAAQEAFLHAFHHLGELREPGLFGVWLLRIARREAVRLARRRTRHVAQPLVGDVNPASNGQKSTPSLSVDSERLLAALARLPEVERLVVVLHYLEGQPVAEIARMLGRPLGTVTKQLSRAIKRLKGTLKEVTP